MIKLKDLIKENVQLPNGVQIQMGKIFTGEGRAFVKEEDIESINERNPDAELYKKLGKIGTDIGNIVKKYEKMADTNKALSTFMVGLHGMLNKMGYKEFK